MKVIIAPAKKMRVDQDDFAVQTQPLFLKEATILQQFLRSRSPAQLQDLWHCSPKIAGQALSYLAWSLKQKQTPAILAFQGIQYQYLAADVLSQAALDYLQENLQILSGFYGLLRPFDGVIPYRLELKTRMTGFIDYSLYHFWGDKVARALFSEDDTVVNLASKEYARLIEPFLQKGQRFIEVVFQEQKHGKWWTAGVHAKMARGELTRFCAQKKIKNPALMQDFRDFGYQYAPEISDSDHYYFRKFNKS